jgi:ABC-2 type transport system permease protein
MNLIRIAICDFRRLSKDKMALVWLLCMPLAFAFIFGSAMSSGGTRSTWIPVIDLDRSELSGLFLDQLRQEGYTIEVKDAHDQAMLKTNWPYGVVISRGFAEKIGRGEKVKLTVVKGDGGADRILEVQSALTQAIVRFTTALAMADASHKPWDDTTRAALKAALARPQLLTVARMGDPSLKPPPTGFYMSLPGILVMFVLQMVLIYGGITLVSDRKNGQLARLMAAPVPAWQVYAGKIVARVALALAQSALLLGLGAVLFKIHLGAHPLFLVPIVLCFAVFAGCLSILGGIICRTEKQVSQMAIFLAMLLSALGGCWWPLEVVPDSFKLIAHLTPTYWGMHGLQSVIYFNRSFEVFWSECPALLFFAALCLGAAFLVARRRVKG